MGKHAMQRTAGRFSLGRIRWQHVVGASIAGAAVFASTVAASSATLSDGSNPTDSGILMTGRAYGISANVGLFGQSASLINPIPVTQAVSTTTTSSTAPGCLYLPPGMITAHALCPSVATDGPHGIVDANASTADATVGVPGLPVIILKVVQSHANVGCYGSVGTTTIAYLQIGSTVVIATPTTYTATKTVTVGVVSVTFDEKIASATDDARSLTVNAVHIKANAFGLATADVVVASSTGGVSGCYQPLN